MIWRFSSRTRLNYVSFLHVQWGTAVLQRTVLASDNDIMSFFSSFSLDFLPLQPLTWDFDRPEAIDLTIISRVTVGGSQNPIYFSCFFPFLSDIGGFIQIHFFFLLWCFSFPFGEDGVLDLETKVYGFSWKSKED